MLNRQQADAVKYIDGPLLVLAGAGSGKTRVITQKIAYLITECGHEARKIMAVTFTNKAAREMQARLANTLTKEEKRGLKVSTFHTLGLNILKKEYAHLGLKSGFSIFDADDSLNVIKNLLTRNQASDKTFVGKVQNQISLWKNDMLCPKKAFTLTFDKEEQIVAGRIYMQYEQTLNTYNAVDFDDLIAKPVRLFLSNGDALERWQHKIHYLLVDEYQDTNACQYQMVKLLVGHRGAFTVVGDDDQSIYAWRGAMPENLSLLKKDFPKLRVVKLEQNYRSARSILQCANHLISHNPHLFEKQLWSDLGFGEMIRVIQTKDEFDEAEQVAAEIIAHKLRFNTNFGEYAILYRGNHQSRLFEKTLRDNAIPYKLSGGQSYFARTEIKDIFSYIRLICNPLDDNAFLRIINTPKRGLGNTTIDKLGRYALSRNKSLFNCCSEFGLKEFLPEKACDSLMDFQQWIEGFVARAESEPLAEVLQQLVRDIDYETYLYENSDDPKRAEKKMSNIWDLIAWIDKLANKDPANPLSLEEVVAKIILLDILDRNEEEASNQVQLMTLHASKGLEFPYVYLVGMEEEFLPHRTSIEEDNIEEERRLAYVGITRAQKTLSITLALKRKRYGDVSDCVPSRFLDELPPELLQWNCAKVQDKEKSKEQGKAHLSSIKALLSMD